MPIRYQVSGCDPAHLANLLALSEDAELVRPTSARLFDRLAPGLVRITLPAQHPPASFWPGVSGAKV